ncbi:hypothetical protein [Dietzia alimentaria]|uniref:hypothetical protein n=1 Tax=Dietzia alimentaria TaxID=665550 RepID=UPI00029AD970|nr:hypothetical protein [Dietzia alimentaria]
MFTVRNAARTTAALGAAAALTVAGAGAAMATTHTNATEGNDVSVTFTLEAGELVDSCAAVLTPTAAAGDLAAQLADGDLEVLIAALLTNENVIVLKNGVLPTAPLSLVNPTGKVTAQNVPSNVYALVSVCGSDPSNPEVNPFLLVGDPMEAVMGSLEMGSANGGLDTASALLGGAGDADSGSDIGAILGGGLGETGSAGEGE